MNREHMIINMGPHHPSTHGVLRLVVELDGETVVNVDPDLGYLHSGFEKTGENKRYKDFVYYTDRMDYISGMNNNYGYVLAVEKMMGMEIPAACPGDPGHHERAAAHRFAPALAFDPRVGRFGHGHESPHVCHDRAGAHPRSLRDGLWRPPDRELYSRRRRLEGSPPAFLGHLADFVRVLPSKIDDYEKMLTDAPLWDVRLKGIGKLTRAETINMGLTGPMLRGSGVDWDLRRDMPYGGYENYDFKVPV